MSNTHNAAKVASLLRRENEWTVNDEVETIGGGLVLVVNVLAGVELEEWCAVNHILEAIHAESREQGVVKSDLL